MIVRNMDEIVERIESLPRLPSTAARIVAVLNDPNSTVRQIVETIRYDQTITTELLRVCNSAYFALSKSVGSVDEAIALLGTARVLHLVIAAHTQALLSKPQEGYGLRPGELWTHCVAVAIGCQIVSRRFGLPHGGPVFTAGLLHDIGKVVLNEYVSAEYAEIVRQVREEHVSFLDAERRTLGFTHPEIGAKVAAHWELPEPIVRCIRYHHEPEALPAPDPLVDAVHISDAVNRVLGVGAGDDGLLYPARPAVLERHNLTETDLQAIGADVVVELKLVEQAFAVV